MKLKKRILFAIILFAIVSSIIGSRLSKYYRIVIDKEQDYKDVNGCIIIPNIFDGVGDEFRFSVIVKSEVDRRDIELKHVILYDTNHILSEYNNMGFFVLKEKDDGYRGAIELDPIPFNALELVDGKEYMLEIEIEYEQDGQRTAETIAYPLVIRAYRAGTGFILFDILINLT